MPEENAAATTTLGDVETSTNSIIDKIFGELKATAGVENDGTPRLFFPGGINNISFTVNVTNLVDVTITISGPPTSSLNAAAVVEETDPTDSLA